MKKSGLHRVALVLFLGLPLRVMAADEIPVPFNFDRYAGMMEHSPFAVATAVAPPVETANFAKDLYVANAAHSRDGDFVTIASSTDRNFKKYLTNHAPVDGFSVTEIEWSDKVGATKVTIAKDGQTATLGFNEALLRQPGGGAAPPPPQQAFQPPPDGKGDSKDAKQQQDKALGQIPITGAAGVPNAAGANQPNAPKAMPVPVLPTQGAHVRGVIPRNPPAAPAQKPPPSQ